MRDAYLQLVHEAAARDHDTKAQARAFRAAATAIAIKPPVGAVESQVFKKIIARLRADAAELESSLNSHP